MIKGDRSLKRSKSKTKHVLLLRVLVVIILAGMIGTMALSLR